MPIYLDLHENDSGYITSITIISLVDVMRDIYYGGGDKPRLHTLSLLQTSQADNNVVQSNDINS